MEDQGCNGYQKNDHNHRDKLINLPDKLGFQAVMRFYVVIFILLVLFAPLLQFWNFNLGMILTQVVLILFPTLWYWRRYRVSQPAYSRLHSLNLRFIPIIVLISISMFLVNLIIAAILFSGLERLGFDPPVILEPPQTLQDYLTYIIILSVFAGICEEMLFRGTIMPAMESHGLVPAVIFSSLLFAFFHGSFLNLLSSFLLGAVMAVIVIKTNSLWGGIFYHMLNNFYAATFLYASAQYETLTTPEPDNYLMLIPLLLISLAGVFLGMILLQKYSKFKPLLHTRSSWLPRGWPGWPLFVSVAIFLYLAMTEMAVGFNWFGLADLL